MYIYIPETGVPAHYAYCHAHKVDTSQAIGRRFSNITPNKSAIP